MIRIGLILVALALVANVGVVAAADKVKISFLCPPAEYDRVYSGGDRLGRIAVFDFKTIGKTQFQNLPLGEYAANRLIETMQDPDLGLAADPGSRSAFHKAASSLGFSSDPGGRRTFQIAARSIEFVERKNLLLASEEFKLSAGQMITEETAPRIGEMVGSNVLAHGTIAATTSEVMTPCEMQDSKGKKVTTRGCTRTVDISIFVSLFDASLSQIRYSRTISQSTKDSNCQCDAARSLESLAREAVDLALATIAMELLPHYRECEIELVKIEEDKRKKPSESALNELKRLVRESPPNQSHLDPCGLSAPKSYFAGALKEDAYLHEAQYMMGVFSELQNDFPAAQSYYQNAADMIDEKLYRAAVLRTTQRIEDREKLAGLGVPLDVADCADPETGGASRRVRIDRDQAELRQSPDPNSDVLHRLRKGIKLKVLGSSGDYYEVELLDGGKGFLLKSDANPVE